MLKGKHKKNVPFKIHIYGVTSNFLKSQFCLVLNQVEMAKQDKKEEKHLDPRIHKVADKLKRIRIEKGFTSYENFAVDHGISRMQYWRTEKGTNFTFESLLRILDAHKMSLGEFFSDIE